MTALKMLHVRPIDIPLFHTLSTSPKLKDGVLKAYALEKNLNRREPIVYHTRVLPIKDRDNEVVLLHLLPGSQHLIVGFQEGEIQCWNIDADDEGRCMTQIQLDGVPTCTDHWIPPKTNEVMVVINLEPPTGNVE